MEFGVTYKEEMQKKINYELFNLRDPDNLSPHFESILKISPDSLSYIIGLDSNVTIIDQGQAGSTTSNHKKYDFNFNPKRRSNQYKLQ